MNKNNRLLCTAFFLYIFLNYFCKFAIIFLTLAHLLQIAQWRKQIEIYWKRFFYVNAYVCFVCTSTCR